MPVPIIMALTARAVHWLECVINANKIQIQRNYENTSQHERVSTIKSTDRIDSSELEPLIIKM